jgi:hypothetical protein
MGVVYNAGLEGSSPSTALRYLRHAIGLESVQLVVLGVDFLDYRIDPTASTIGAERVQESENRRRPLFDAAQRRRDVVDTLLSLDALVDSVKTVAAQRDAFAPNMTALGLVTMREYVAIGHRLGYHALFVQKDLEYAQKLSDGRTAIIAADGRPSPQWETLVEFVKMCRAHRIRIVLIIYPYHAHVLELFDAADLWRGFEDWKRELVALLVREVPDDAKSGNATLWDFSGFNPYTTEPVPAEGDLAKSMRWYRDPGHFTRELGDLVLARILPQRSTEDADKFGVLLTPKNVEESLARIVQERGLYRDEHPEVRTQILQLMADQKRPRR